MKRLSLQLAVLFVALLSANFQCAARCAGNSCHDAATPKPPCHEPPAGSTSTCQDSFLAPLETSPNANLVPILSGAWLSPVGNQASPLVIGVSSSLSSRFNSPPLFPQALFHAVLRI